jgi:DNA polymerase I-like protein with 3'-5' exonuclease and polymerase domains
MHDYCERDTLVTLSLFRFLEKEAISWYGEDWLEDLSVKVVHRVAEVCAKIERNGWPFKTKEAQALYAHLAQERQDLEDQLVEAFGTWVVAKPTKVAGTSSKAFGYVKGLEYTPVKFVTFNPKSLDHIAKRLQDIYGWEPLEFTETGKPKLDEGVLGSLVDEYPEVALLSRFLMVSKRIAQIAEGKEAWLRHVRSTGRIHGSYVVNGTLSGRASHRKPNKAQVPANDAPYGPECRDLWHAGDWVQVGTDASGLELRCLAHRLARFDGGHYSRTVTEGDVHTTNQHAAGLPSRPDAKTFIYAFLYGAGDRKIGTIVKPSDNETTQVYAGRSLKKKFTERTPGLAKLLKGLKKHLETTRFIRGIDGRRLFIRERHAALNTDLQSMGAVICSIWISRVDWLLTNVHGLHHGWDGDYVFLGWIHDELQMAARTPEIAQKLGEVAKAAIKDVEGILDFRCPLDAEFKIGTSWKETH